MQQLKNSFFLLLGLLLIMWSGYVMLHKPAPAKYQPQLAAQTLKIGDKTLTVELAETDTEREHGLSDRASLPTGHGMLFIFNTRDTYGFWMKDMNFPIDIIWLDDSYHVVDIARSVSPNSFPQVFYPPVPVKYVLETNPGEL